MSIIVKDLTYIIKRIFFSEKKLLKKRIIRSIKNGYEKEIKILPKLLKKNEDSIDVGVFRGVYTYELARLSNHVHAYEANPIIYNYLEKNITKLINNVTLNNCAVSDKKGNTNLRVPIRRKTFFKSQFEEKYHAGLGTIHQNNKFNDFDTFNVETIKLDDINFKKKIGFIKIDVEGHELNVINGAVNLLDKDKPNLLVEIEEKHSKRKLVESINSIKKLDYKCYTLKNNILLETIDLENVKKEINFIFIHKSNQLNKNV